MNTGKKKHPKKLSRKEKQRLHHLSHLLCKCSPGGYSGTLGDMLFAWIGTQDFAELNGVERLNYYYRINNLIGFFKQLE